MNTQLFVAYYTNFEHKPGHMFLDCLGIFSNWEDAYKTALNVSSGGLVCDHCEISNEEADITSYKSVTQKLDLCENCWADIKPDEKDDLVSQPLVIPKTRNELESYLPTNGCVWKFEWGKCVKWWDGVDFGSRLICVSQHEVDGFTDEDE